MHLKIINLLISINLLNTINCWPTFLFFPNVSPSNPVQLTRLNDTNTIFDHSKETKFIIHGFGDSWQKTRMAKVKDKLTLTKDYNVFIIDWEKGAAAPDYFKAAGNTKIVGKSISDFILQNNIDPAKVHCIGHSLGAHVCGFAGKNVKLNRISGLDPAGPLFKGKGPEERLDKNDADFVDNIHTDWLYGIQDAIGHQDFYPNGGASQYGCSLFDGKSLTNEFESIPVRISPRFDPIDLVACNHMRVPLYYAESVNSDCRFRSAKCSDYDKFKAGKCKCVSGSCAQMGFWANKVFGEGTFYLDTNKNEPYCKS